MDMYYRAIKATNTSYRKACYKVGARVEGWSAYNVSYSEFMTLGRKAAARCRQLGQPDKAAFVEYLMKNCKPLEYTIFSCKTEGVKTSMERRFVKRVVIPDVDCTTGKEMRKGAYFADVKFIPDMNYVARINRMIEWAKGL